MAECPYCYDCAVCGHGAREYEEALRGIVAAYACKGLLVDGARCGECPVCMARAALGETTETLRPQPGRPVEWQCVCNKWNQGDACIACGWVLKPPLRQAEPECGASDCPVHAQSEGDE